MAWWIWIACGLLLLVFEALTPGVFVAFFFGLAAVLVGCAVGLGLDAPLWVQGLLYSVVAVGSLLVLRRPMRNLVTARPGADLKVENLIGEIALPAADLAPGDTGSAELRGTAWTVRNADAREVKRGQRCKVEKVDGLLLWIRAE